MVRRGVVMTWLLQVENNRNAVFVVRANYSVRCVGSVREEICVRIGRRLERDAGHLKPSQLVKLQ